MIVVIFAVALAIFLSLTRRRFGTFILALLAGVSVDHYWNGQLVDFLTTASLNIPKETLSGAAGLIIILAPAILILGKGGKQPNWLFAVIQSIAVSVLVSVIALPSIAKVFSLDVYSKDLLLAANNYVGLFIIIGMVLAILDILSFKVTKPGKK